MSEQKSGYENLFSKGCLVQLSIGVLGIRKQLSEGERALLQKRQTAGKSATSSGKNIIDKKWLEKINRNRNEARVYLKSMSTPFPIAGVAFVSFAGIEKVDERMRGYEQRHNELVDELIGRNYILAKMEAREDLRVIEDGEEVGSLYNRRDYPRDLREHFSFGWRFITMNAPGENSLLDPELVQREQEKFIRTMEEAREMGVAALREEFSEILRNCVDRLENGEGGKRKIFKDSLMGNFFDFFETFKTRNVFDDEALRVLCQQAEMILNGVTPGKLREDDNLRQVVKVSMQTLAGALDAAIVDAPVRKIRLED